MTYNDIITKFKIEYDKANVTSSYPSLTEYEIATVLDKAYLNLIAQKFTGNNTRRAAFETDYKIIADLLPLVVTKRIKFGEGVDGGDKKGATQFPKTNQFWEKTTDEMKSRNQASGQDATDSQYLVRPNEEEYISTSARAIPDNVRLLVIPEDMMYFVSAAIPVDIRLFSGWMNDTYYDYYSGDADDKNPTNNTLMYQYQLVPLDNKLRDYMKWLSGKIGEAKHYRMAPIIPVSHKMAELFFATAYNIPWVKRPVAYFENNMMFVVVDPIVGVAELPYTEDGVLGAGASVEDDQCAEWASLTYVKSPDKFVKSSEDTIFQLSDTAAEELVSLAVTYALENVESPRISTHVGLKGLES